MKFPTSNVRVLCKHRGPLLYRFPLINGQPHLIQVCPECGEQVFPEPPR